MLDDRYVTGRQEDLLVTQYDMWMEFHSLRDYMSYPVVRCGSRWVIGEPEYDSQTCTHSWTLTSGWGGLLGDRYVSGRQEDLW